MSLCFGFQIVRITKIKTTEKNINPIIKGETIFPKKIPNLNQILFSGVNIIEFNNPRTRKIKEMNNDQILIFSLFNNGNIDTIKKNIKKIIPKLLFELIFSLFFISI